MQLAGFGRGIERLNQQQNRKVKMKLIKSITAAAILTAGFTVQAQTNSVSTNSAWYVPLENLGTDIINATNVAVTAGADVMTSGQEKGKVGFDLLAFYDLNNYTALGGGLDYMGQLNLFSGNVQLKLPIHPLTTFGLTNFTATPVITAGIGSAFAGAGTDNGGITTIYNGGLAVGLTSWHGWDLGAAAGFGTRTGAGKYSGDDFTANITASRNF
jgi:hypothetical protein